MRLLNAQRTWSASHGSGGCVAVGHFDSPNGGLLLGITSSRALTEHPFGDRVLPIPGRQRSLGFQIHLREIGRREMTGRVVAPMGPSDQDFLPHWKPVRVGRKKLPVPDLEVASIPGWLAWRNTAFPSLAPYVLGATDDCCVANEVDPLVEAAEKDLLLGAAKKSMDDMVWGGIGSQPSRSGQSLESGPLLQFLPGSWAPDWDYWINVGACRLIRGPIKRPLLEVRTSEQAAVISVRQKRHLFDVDPPHPSWRSTAVVSGGKNFETFVDWLWDIEWDEQPARPMAEPFEAAFRHWRPVEKSGRRVEGLSVAFAPGWVALRNPGRAPFYFGACDDVWTGNEFESLCQSADCQDFVLEDRFNCVLQKSYGFAGATLAGP